MSELRRRYKSAATGGRRRSAMGEFIPRPGERPLSSFGQPTPSAFDYYPSTDAVFSCSPSHSLHSRPYPLSKEETPGPPHYYPQRGPYKDFTLTRKGTTRPYDPRENAHITCSPGAGHYRKISGNIGSGTRRSMSARHREGLHVGYPNSQIQPVDTLGFATPGPNLRQESDRGSGKTFGAHRPCVVKERPHKLFVGHSTKCSASVLACNPLQEQPGGPGPAAYSVQLPTPISPGKSMGQRLQVDTDHCSPAPNAYTLTDTLASTPGKTFGLKNDIDTDQYFPAPNIYSLPQPHSVSCSFNYRSFPMQGEQRPGPAEYSSSAADLPRAPDFTCRNKCRPVFPDILLYPEYVPEETPGAGQYDCGRDFADNSAPKHSHGLPLPLTPNSNPGPSDYTIKQELTKPHPPSFTMRHRLSDHTPQSLAPGPADYHPKPRPSSAVSITPRRSREKVPAGPAANQYTLPAKVTRRGSFPGPTASLKGRRSTACYSGFPSSQLARLSSLAM